MLPLTTPAVPPSIWRWRLLAAVLILGAAGLHVLYLARDCPLDLAQDEAHYWDWSRHLDWSYYSKGPLVAWLIRGGCELFGNTALGVRLPAVACGSLLLAGLYVLTVQVFRSERLACAVVAVALTLPPIAAGSTLMTIDSPYTCCWCWALVLGHRALFRGSPWAWIGTGLVVGVGILAKYTMVLYLPAVVLFLLTSREHRVLLRRRGFWLMTAAAAICCLPILIWNIEHDWVTIKHVFRLAGVSETPTTAGSSIHWEGPLVYVGTQAALLLGYWFVVWAAAMWSARPWVENDAGKRYLWWTSGVMFLVFLGFSVKTRGGEPNWPIAGYVGGLVLTGGWLARQLDAAAWWRRLTLICLGAACVVSLSVTLLMHRSDLIYPLLARAAGPATAQQRWPIRRLDPTCRLRGWQTLASVVDELREREGSEPVLVGTSWALPGEIGFYCAGHPAVYSVGPVVGDRRSQYDLWKPNPIKNAGDYKHRTFIVVGNFTPDFGAAFGRVDPPILVTHVEAGQPVAGWVVTVCHDFNEFPITAGTDDNF